MTKAHLSIAKHARCQYLHAEEKLQRAKVLDHGLGVDGREMVLRVNAEDLPQLFKAIDEGHLVALDRARAIQHGIHKRDDACCVVCSDTSVNVQ